MTDNNQTGNTVLKLLLAVCILALLSGVGLAGYVVLSQTKIEISWNGEAYINMESSEDKYQREKSEVENTAKARQRQLGPSSIHLSGKGGAE